METIAEIGNDPVALTRAGRLHLFGIRGVPQDPLRAAEYFEHAVHLGDGRAMFLLGEMHLHGRGVPENPDRARDLLQRAADLGVVEGINGLAFLYAHGKGVDRVRWRDIGCCFRVGRSGCSVMISSCAVGKVGIIGLSTLHVRRRTPTNGHRSGLRTSMTMNLHIILNRTHTLNPNYPSMMDDALSVDRCIVTHNSTPPPISFP